MKMSLIEYEMRFREILKLRPSPQRDAYLLLLMQEIEESFDIPIDDNPIWESENIEVSTLYKLIRHSRTE
ncbi:hypothetical protein [Exiguobacterium sp. s155]|uniref:hypothetical protein n=1 Tax=Exiguobacterium sp. s155 TaxID=2751286 RepID=UPI001BE83560|nr:hypothetical protein [Exiguobacterium sp. s155]